MIMQIADIVPEHEVAIVKQGRCNIDRCLTIICSHGAQFHTTSCYTMHWYTLGAVVVLSTLEIGLDLVSQ